KSLCEFFSGFWCIQPSPTSATDVVGLNQINSSTLANPINSSNNNPSLPDVVVIDQAVCVQATMRCDNLPDYLSDKYDAWVSKLPWIVLAPVPAILICALIRICTQKRQLDLIEDHHLSSMDCSIRHNNASVNKLSSVLEVEDEIDDVDQRQEQQQKAEEEENMLAMKVLNVMTNSTYSTAGLIDSTDDNKVLKHAYSLPECDLKLPSGGLCVQQGDEQSSGHCQQVDWFPQDRKSLCSSLINGNSASKFNQNPMVGDMIISNACYIDTDRDNGRPTTSSEDIDDTVIHFNNEVFVKCRSYNDLQQAMIQKEEGDQDIQMTCLSYSSHLNDADGDGEQVSSVCTSSSSSLTTSAATASSLSLSSPQVNLSGCETSCSSDIPASFVISSNPDLCIQSLSSPPPSPSSSTSIVLSTLQKHLLQSKKYAMNRIHHQFFMPSSYPVSKHDHRNNSTTNSSNSSRSKLLLMESAQSIEDNR
ncbi:unnamed protein product, partial [Trichobilharzia regenti]